MPGPTPKKLNLSAIPPRREGSGIGTRISPVRTAGGCGVRNLSPKMRRRKAQRRKKARARA